MTTINRAPLGLLGFLGVKNFGRNPDNLATQLAPTWPLERLYLASASGAGPIVSAVLALGINQVWEVPQDQVWYVEAASLRTTGVIPGAQSGRFQLITGSQGSSIWNARGPSSIAFQAGEYATYGYGDFYAMPGTVIGFFAINTNITNVMRMEIQRTVLSA